ncbi:D-alanyl-D-alanine carboxypeptidase/D-alanyl-D-alanine-endopeptidase (penicillin-binding protein 4) [Halopolyspora algeriensis]|uniref:D-alanyl-D-alanine carboxypeptidase/D-alanyl-D-alanine-endopeptidase (Penicillin-binding protein 4) n=1 Tax=Halopolyspora algeriensis TaxID=1500506 RepID=A0A368VIZ5_9ACTN|nr:D-alanyl-D-alanine carboxypeptidase/D-alanyl-D-alanine-endopeptidase [Halopolyspora algeriensis]RCW40184.1 D-alanyl-D-alanine carboxypeptidase/D-alanyl-D-alanine-endopeptidase (penicillin-binding protein 4) [Halopolyspora algeriensis]TQM46334.1 D-alanyl-D-alanine carboxypeptidase/D-alanyl-D-alanine-endopeptidase (penicillin-binding protein 4) [Halopolyspora algeriensis]
MSEPHNPSGEVPDSGADDASPDSGDASRPSARPAGETEQESEPAWPVEDPEEPAGVGEQGGTRPEQEPERSDGFAHLEELEQDTDRIGWKRGYGTEAAAPEPGRSSGEPGAGTSTVRVSPVPPPGPSEEPTRQFPRPDFSGPPPEWQRPVHPVGFAAHPDSRQGSRQDPVPPPAPRPDEAVPGAASGWAEPHGAQGTSAPETPEWNAPPDPETAGTSPAVPLYRRRGVLAAVSLAAVVVLAAGLVVGGSVLFGDGPDRRAEPPPPVQLRPAIKPLRGSGAELGRQQLSAVLEQAVSNPALGTFGGVVVDPASGRTLWQHSAQQALIPASTAKLFTASAALLALDHRHRFSTKVVRGTEPGSVVLVGGGDPTLSSLPEDAESVYPGAAHLDTLVAEVRKATGGEVTSITVDTSRYTGPELAPGWLPEDVRNGYVAPVEPVMLDGGRADPGSAVSRRSEQPALDAGRELARRLGVPTSEVALGEAPPDAPVLGEVESATVQRMVRTALQRSDNVLAEALAREVAISTGFDASFAGATAAIRTVLTNSGIDLAGTHLADGSGLSLQDRVTPTALGSLLASASAPVGSESALPASATKKLRALLPALPVAGSSGSLESRYQEEASNARGWVRAKTGTLSDVNSLAGTVVTRGGHLLVFAMISNGTPADVARPALDAVAAALRTCGCR